jgi:hypothetical protein
VVASSFSLNQKTMELKTYTPDELKERAKAVFEKYPKAQKVSATSDGECFIVDESDHHAKNHSVKNRYGKELKISTFTRDEIEGGAEQGKTAKELIEVIKIAETVEAVQAIIDEETAGAARKSVLEAGAKRIETLNAPK